MIHASGYGAGIALCYDVPLVATSGVPSSESTGAAIEVKILSEV
jgi:hypothetical protein